jgi:hypothetical protein
MKTGQARFARVPFLWLLRACCFGGLFVSSRAEPGCRQGVSFV